MELKKVNDRNFRIFLKLNYAEWKNLHKNFWLPNERV